MTIYDEILITQKTFRILLKAMSHPGRVFLLDRMSSKDWLMLILQTLLDSEVSYYVVDNKEKLLKQRIEKITGSKQSKIEDADFIIITSGNSEGLINQAKRGTLEYPDIGATAIYSVNSILPISSIGHEKTNKGFNLSLKGPGINGEISLFISGVSKEEIYYLKEINSEYPLGIDSIFVDTEGKIMCIPRSSMIEVV